MVTGGGSASTIALASAPGPERVVAAVVTTVTVETAVEEDRDEGVNVVVELVSAAREPASRPPHAELPNRTATIKAKPKRMSEI